MSMFGDFFIAYIDRYVRVSRRCADRRTADANCPAVYALVHIMRHFLRDRVTGLLGDPALI